jgi:hypothetical protein
MRHMNFYAVMLLCCYAVVEDGTQGLHFCRLEEFTDDPLDANAAVLAEHMRSLSANMIE